VKSSLRLGFVLCVVGLAAIAAILAGSVRNPGVGARVAYAAEPVDIELHGSQGFEVISLDTACSSNLYPGLVCSERIEVRNAGNLPFAYTIQAWSDVDGVDDGLPGYLDDTPAPCINVNIEAEAVDGLDAGDQPVWGPLPAGFLLAGGSQAWGFEVSVDDLDACQGQHAFVFAYVVATSEEAAPETPPIDDGALGPGEDGGDGGSGGAGGGGGGGGGAGGPQPPQSPLDGRGGIFTPPSTGGGGLIGARPGANSGDRTLLVLLATAFSVGGLVCAGGLQALERRR
jgi:hypothetical protein